MNDRRDLTTGNVGKKLLQFSMPIMGIMLLQSVYNIVDMIIVGQFVGAAGMSAISNGGQLTQLVLFLMNGLANGAAVIIGQLYGFGRKDDAKKVVSSFLGFCVILGLIITILVEALGVQLITLLQTPEESIAGAVSYLAICSLGTVFIYIYNVFYSALRGTGESFAPMVIILVTTVMNIILDLVFVSGFGGGVAGAAWATVISQVTSTVLITAYVCRKTDLFELKLSSLRIYWDKLAAVLKVGLPQAIQFVTTNLSFLAILSIINGYGYFATAAAGAANKIFSFGIIPGQALMSGIITMTAQNHPKGDFKRIMSGWRFAEVIVCIASVLMTAACIIWPGQIYSAFTREQAVRDIGITYLRYFSICFIFENFMFCVFGVVTGSGYTYITFICAIVAAIGVRYTLAYALSRYTVLGFNGIAVAYGCAPIAGIVISGLFLISGRWKRNRLIL